MKTKTKINDDTENLSEIAILVRDRIDELRPSKLQVEVAKEAGYANQNMLALIKAGKVKVSLEKALPLARALEVNEREFLILTLKQFHSEKLVEQVISVLNSDSR